MALIPRPCPAALAETLLIEWEQRTLPDRSPTYEAARRTMLEQLAELSKLTEDFVAVNIGKEDVRHVLHHAFSLRIGTATASGPDRATRVAQLVASVSQTHLLGPAPAYPASTALLGITSRPGAELEMDELTSITEAVQTRVLHDQTTLFFGHDIVEAQVPELQVCLLIGYGAVATTHRPVPAYCPEYLLRAATAAAGQSTSPATGRDVLFEEAARLFVLHQRVSIPLIQRRLELGYNRTCRLLEQLQEAGIVGPTGECGKQPVLIADEQQLVRHLAQLPSNYSSN